jgi:hypothetical protein
MATRCELLNCHTNAVGTQRVVRDVRRSGGPHGRIVFRQGQIVSLCASCFDGLVAAYDEERRRERVRTGQLFRDPDGEVDPLIWSVEGREWRLHPTSRTYALGPHVAPGYDGVLLQRNGQSTTGYFHAWRQREKARCAACRGALKRRRFTAGPLANAPGGPEADQGTFTLAIGVFATPGPADPDRNLHAERPYALICEECAKRLYDVSERRLDALDPPEDDG